MPDAVFGLVAILAEGDECGQPVRAGSLPMMRAQAIPRATSLAGKIVPHFGPQHPFVNVERLPAAWTTTRDADSIHVKMPGWTSLAHRIVLVRALAVTQVRVRKSPDALVPVAGANQFDPRRKPLMYGEGVPPFVQHGRPSRSALDHPGLLADQGLGTAALVFLEQPAEIAVPGIAADRLEVTEQAGVLVVRGPPSDNGVDRQQRDGPRAGPQRLRRRLRRAPRRRRLLTVENPYVRDWSSTSSSTPSTTSTTATSRAPRSTP